MAQQVPVVEMIVSALGGGGLSQFGHWLTTRSRTKAYTMGAVDHAVQTAMTVVTDRLEKVEKQHAECETSLREVNQRLDASERARTSLKDEMDRLMAGPVASYTGKPDALG